MKTTMERIDAFTDVPGHGNPAGVIWNGDDYTDEEMLRIARAAAYSECCFVCDSQTANLRLRYFMPGQETDLCGHATVGAISAWAARKGLTEDTDLRIETRVGELAVRYHAASAEVEMEQANARFAPFTGDPGALLASIGLPPEALDPRLPIVYGWTGAWTVILPISQLSYFSGMKPDNARFPEVLTDNPRASVHPICFETHDAAHLLHARHFSSAFAGTVEDPVTGTAAGVSGAYLLRYVDKGAQNVDFLVEQGTEMGRGGTVHVKAWREGEELAVRIFGRAVFGERREVEF